MSGDTAFEEINEAKANMDYLYDQPDPRAYFREMQKLGYTIPSVAKPIFQKLISQLQRQRNNSVHVLDLGCSYGVNAALLKHDLSMPELYEHWGQEALLEATPGEVVARELASGRLLPGVSEILPRRLVFAPIAGDSRLCLELLEQSHGLACRSSVPRYPRPRCRPRPGPRHRFL